MGENTVNREDTLLQPAFTVVARTIVARDINGKRTAMTFENGLFNRTAFENIFGTDEDGYEILMVYIGDQIVWSGLGKDTPLTVDDLSGFFA